MPRPSAPAPASGNQLGLIAFCLSLAGFCLPVILSLPGLICGCIAVRREPRGLAIAAIVLGAIGTLVIPLMLALFLPALEQASRAARLVPVESSYAAAETWLTYLDDFQTEHGRMPVSEEELTKATGVAPIADGYGTRLQMRFEGEGDATTVFVWSAGPDLAWDTGDEFVAGCLPTNAADIAGLPRDPIRAIEPGK